VRTYVAPALFAIAFGIEEAIIVVYLRHLPDAFGRHVYGLEMWREFCTLIVIGAVAYAAGKTPALRARSFCFAFGAWDIVYYLALWKLSGYPRLLDNDILFLIPVPWLAPVWSALAFATALMFIGLFGVVRERSGLLALGFVLALISFVYRAAFNTESYPVWLFVVALAFVVFALPMPNVPAFTSNRANS
jgi:hypothetical protein